MDIIEVLLKDHASLRRRIAELEMSLGPEQGVGWSDEVDCDMGSFRSAAKELLNELLAHELREDRGLGEVWALRGSWPEFEKRVAQAHDSLNCLTGLLRAAAECCDGRHVYSVRLVVVRLRDALESHLVYEESLVFPLVRRQASAMRARGIEAA